MKPIIQFATELASRIHKGQKRNNGSDYTEGHLIPVRDIVHQRFYPTIDINTPVVDKNTVTICGAVLHDGPEDTDFVERDIVQEFITAGYFPNEVHYLAKHLYYILVSLNKHNWGSYVRFIDHIDTTIYAKQVKIADLIHNLSDLKAGSLRDKYQLSLRILQNRITDDILSI